MKKIGPQILVLFCTLFSASTSLLAATERSITTTSDNYEEGTLRFILQDACDTAGDDHITFANTRLSTLTITINSPLVIPEDCQGNIELEGSDEVDSIINAKKLSSGGNEPGDSCALDVYSDNHTIRNFSFIKNKKGAGICLFGTNNLVENNRIGTNQNGDDGANIYGIVVSDVFNEDYPGMDGSFNIISANTVTNNSTGGVYVMGENAVGNEITQNSIYNNGTDFPGIDLDGDELTLNDITDEDNGPNTFLNYVNHFQIFPLVNKSDGTERYWGWGASFSGTRLEAYTVADEDIANNVDYGGGKDFVSDFAITNSTFESDPTLLDLLSGETLTLLTFDDDGNTSEYSLNVHVGADSDLDGILDSYETGGSASSDPDLTDTDGDGLPDSVEDENRNGVWDEDKSETKSFDADTDGDGLSDWYETHGDGNFDDGTVFARGEGGIDTNPLVADTDGDSLNDGQEDANHNGIWEGYLNETSPLFTDSDSDGVTDSTDNCPAVYNPYQEEWYCQI